VPADLSYAYQLKRWVLGMMVVMTIFAGALMVSALLRDGALKTTNGQPLSPAWLALLSLGLVAWLVYLGLLLRTAFQGGRTITLTRSHLIIPRQYWSSTSVSIPYNRIERLTLIANRSRLMIRHGGNTNGIAGAYFRTPAELQAFLGELGARSRVEIHRTFTMGKH
jgi:hypothetical protein